MSLDLWTNRLCTKDDRDVTLIRVSSVDPFEISWAIQSYIFDKHVKGDTCIMADFYGCKVNIDTFNTQMMNALKCTCVSRENRDWVCGIITKAMAFP